MNFAAPDDQRAQGGEHPERPVTGWIFVRTGKNPARRDQQGNDNRAHSQLERPNSKQFTIAMRPTGGHKSQF